MPRVRVLGVGVGGLDRKALERKITRIGAAWLSHRPVILQLGDRRLKVSAGRLVAIAPRDKELVTWCADSCESPPRVSSGMARF